VGPPCARGSELLAHQRPGLCLFGRNRLGHRGPPGQHILLCLQRGNFKVQDVKSAEETTPDKHSLRHKIHKYKLFDHNTGAAVTLNAGFGIRFESGHYGYVGYHSLWIPYGASVSDGNTVTRPDTNEQYTLVRKGEKLARHTRASIQLSELDGVEISVWNNGEDAVVVWDAAEETFKKNGDPVLLGAGLMLTNTRYQGGYTIGPLTTDDSYDQSNCWNIFDADVYYQWSASVTQTWSQFTTVSDDSGTLVAFDKPLSLLYTHETANDANGDSTYDGKKFKIEYDGSPLQVPWKFDPDTGDWWPIINLKDGTVLTDSDGNSYVVKGVEEALIMAPAADPSQAAEPVIDTTLPAPDLTYDATKTALVGNEPSSVALRPAFLFRGSGILPRIDRGWKPLPQELNLSPARMAPPRRHDTLICS
jgi:hypothetical protein